MNVTNTKNPTNDAPTANAWVPPPFPASAANVVPDRRDGMPDEDWAEENTVSVATVEKRSAAAPATSIVRRRTSRSSSA